MKTSFSVSLLLFLAGTAFADADLVLKSNNVVTMATHYPQPAQPLAIAVEDGRITWVGSHAEADSHTGPETVVTDLGDQAILPGFVDAHGHIAGVGTYALLANVASPPVGPVKTIADLQEALRTYIEANNIPAGEWVLGRGYDDSLIAEQRHPDRDDLDEVSTDHPIGLVHVSGHLATANSRGLARAGISSETPDPPGGIIRRRPGSQEPNGVLEESAIYPVRAFMNNVAKNPLDTISAAMRTYASNGLTTAQDGAASPDIVELLKAADSAGRLTIDVVAYPVGMNPTALPDYGYGSYENRLKLGGVKLFLDGSPQGKTAYLTRPYLIPPEGQDKNYRGYPSVPAETANRILAFYLERKIPVMAHANGDAAADMLIEAVAAADPQHDHRTVMIHAQTAREDQLTCMKTLGIIPSFFSAHTFYWGDWHRDSVFGVERARRISPTSSTASRGMVFTVHNDAPVVPPDTIRLLWATTNRQTRSGQILGPEQRVSTYQTLQAMTIYAAIQNFEETTKGSIEVGKQADFAVLSGDPLSTPIEDLLDLNVNATYSRGIQVYSRN